MLRLPLVSGRRRGCWTDEERKVRLGLGGSVKMRCGRKRVLAMVRAGCRASGPPNRGTPPLTITKLRRLCTSMAPSKTSDRRQLVLVFCAWKTLLFTLAALCPGPGYDTSGLLLLDPSLNRYANIKLYSRFQHIILNLFRWDALYFVKAAQRGLVFEQEWAFSPAFSKLLGVTGRRKEPRITDELALTQT